jgi:hypothetical protein
MHREAELLLCLARVELDDAGRERARALAREGIDWPRFLALAARHALAPLMQRHLPPLELAGIPKSVIAALWARHEATRRQNLAMAEDLDRILEQLESAGIAAVPYKGPTLALRAYGDITLREFSDLDILVRRDDVMRARDALRVLGYRPQYHLTRAQEQALLRTRRFYDFPVVDRGGGRLVELHWRPDAEFDVLPLEEDAWWARRSVSSEELCLVLCLHGTKHFWSSLRWLVDVAELARRDPLIDWHRIVAKSRATGCERHLGVALRLAHELLRMPLPDEAMALTEDRVVRGLATRIRATLFAADYHPFGLGEAVWWNLRLQRTFARRARHAFDATVMPGWADWLRWRLPRPLFALYFPLRFVRLTAKYVFRAREPELPPGLENDDRDGVREVEAAIAGTHRQP